MFDFRTYCSSSYLRKICYGQQNGALLTGVMDKESVKPDMIKGEYGNNINIKYLHKIIDYCNSYSLKLFLVYFPVYHPEYYYDQDYYYEQIGKIKPSEGIKFLDYSNYPIPDSCRYDAHHLNKDGAEMFTKIIMNRIDVE